MQYYGECDAFYVLTRQIITLMLAPLIFFFLLSKSCHMCVLTTANKLIISLNINGVSICAFKTILVLKLANFVAQIVTRVAAAWFPDIAQKHTHTRLVSCNFPCEHTLS